MSSENRRAVDYQAPEVKKDDVGRYIDLRRWQSPSIIVGSSLAYTPFASDLLANDPGKLLDPSNVWEHFSNVGQAYSRSESKAGKTLQDIKHYPFLYLRPTFLAALPVDHFLKRESVVVSEPIVASEVVQNESLLSLMARFPSYLPLMRKTYGPDASVFRYSSSTSSVRQRLSDATDARLIAHHLMRSGVISPEEAEKDWPETAKTLLAKAWGYYSYGEYKEIGKLPVALALSSGAGELIHYSSVSSIPEVYTYRLDAISTGNQPPSSNEGLSPIPVIELLTNEAILLMEKAGWVKPERYFRLPLMMLKEAASRGKNPLEEWKMIKGETSPIFGREFPGSFIYATEQLIFHIATETAFRQELTANGIPTTFVRESADRRVRIKEGRPEHLLVQLANDRKARSAQIIGNLGTLNHRSSSGESSYIERAAAEIDSYLGGFANYTKDINWQALLGFIPDTVQSAYSALLERVRNELSGIGFGPVSAKQTERISNFTIALDRIGRGYSSGQSFSRNPDGTQKIERFNFYAGYYGDLYKAALVLLDESAVDQREIVANDINLEPGRPMVLLGSNGQGKSTIISTILQQQFYDGQVVASESEIPPNMQLLAGADTIELKGTEQVFWGRQEGKSSFLMEFEETIKRLNAMLTDGQLFLNTGDEVGRRTDQLNAMALLGTELLVAGHTGSLSVQTSHCNALNRQLGPLLKKLGVDVDWSTMRNFRLTQLESGEVVKSNALRQAAPFLPKQLGERWAAISDETLTDFGTEHITFSPEAIQEERLTQLGWLEKNHLKQFRLAGLPNVLLGMNYSSPVKNRYRNYYSFGGQAWKYSDEATQLYAGTLLNSQWKEAGKVPEWICRIQQQPEGAFVKAMDTFTEVFETVSQVNGYIEAQKNQRLPLSGQDANILREKVRTLRNNVKVYRQALGDMREIISDMDWSEVEKFLDELPTINDLTSLPDAFYKARDPLMVAEGLHMIATNSSTLGMAHAESNGSNISIRQGWSFDLLQNRQNQKKPVVKNDIVIDKSVFFSGPQGSGKTEALYTVAENLMAARLWGMATADSFTYDAPYEVLPFITVPEADDKSRPLSSLEREVDRRMAAVVDFCEMLPSGVKPIVVMDEPLSSTNTQEAADGIRAIKVYLEERGGILICATHSHEAIWDMEKEKEDFKPMTVGLFDTPEAYRWREGHGASMGIEVAQRMGMDPRLVAIATAFRDFLSDTAGGRMSMNEAMEHYANVINPLLQEIISAMESHKTKVIAA